MNYIILQHGKRLDGDEAFPARLTPEKSPNCGMCDLPEKIDFAERCRLRGVVRQLLKTVRQGYIIQIERVLSHLCSNQEKCQEIQGPQDIISKFKLKKLIPPVLFEAIKQENGEIAETICFAACAYPNRADKKISNDELHSRVKMFMDIYRNQEVGPREQLEKKIIQFKKEKVPSNIPNFELDELLEDITAAGEIEKSVGESREQIKQDRMNGAALYLSTCGEKKLLKIIDNWKDDAKLIRFLRTSLQLPPSALSRRNLNFDATVNKLKDEFTNVDIKVIKKAVELEFIAIRILAAKDEISNIPEHLLICWEDVFNKLISGFPFYGFHSHYAQWWKKVIINYIPNGNGEFIEGEDNEDNEKDNNDEEILTGPEFLYFGREGYRLVRSTFFRIEGTENLNVSDKESRTNESFRKKIDNVWFNQLMNPDFESQQEVENELGLNRKQIYELVSDIRNRMRAYALARRDQLGNEEILKKTTSRPAGIATIATISRIVPCKDTFLWAFTARVFLHSEYVDKQHPDDWNFVRWVGELWWWDCEQLLSKIEKSAETHASKKDYAVLDGMIKSLIKDLQAIQPGTNIDETWNNIELWLEKQDGKLSEIEERVREILNTNHLLPENFNFGINRLKHWTVPAWYLINIENQSSEDALSRLKPDENEKARVTCLVKAFEQQRNQRKVI